MTSLIQLWYKLASTSQHSGADMDRKKLEKLAWQKTGKDFKSKWNKGDCTMLKLVPGQGTCLWPISKFSDDELMEIAGLKKHSEKHEFQARTNSPVADCRVCGKPRKHDNHHQEPTEETWETKTRRDETGELQ